MAERHTPTLEQLHRILTKVQQELLDGGADLAVVQDKSQKIQAALDKEDLEGALSLMDDLLLMPTDTLLAEVRRQYRSIMDDMYR